MDLFMEEGAQEDFVFTELAVGYFYAQAGYFKGRDVKPGGMQQPKKQFIAAVGGVLFGGDVFENQ